VSYSAQDVLDLSELSYLIEAKLDAVIDRNVNINFRSNFVNHLSEAYAIKSCQKYLEFIKK
jgi:hypothetical protein